MAKPEVNAIQILYGAWNSNFLPNTIKTFIFKLMSNTLGVGARVVHINENTDAGCTYCTIMNIRPVPLETVQHIFWDCPTVSSTLKVVSRHYLGFEINKNEFLGLNFSLTNWELYCINNFLNILKYVIWNNKLRKKLITANLVIQEVDFHLEYIFGVNRKLAATLSLMRHYLMTKRRG